MLTPDKIKAMNDITGLGVDENSSAPASPVSTQANAPTPENDPILSAINTTKEKNKSLFEKGVDVAKNIGSAVISNEKNFADSLTPAISQMLPDSITGQKALDDAEKMKRENQQRILTKIQEDHAQGKDVTKLIETLKNTLGEKPTTMKDLLPNTDKTATQVAGEGAGVALDILSGGSYGNAAKGAQTGKLLTTTAMDVAEQQAIKDIAAKTGKTIAQVTAEEAIKKVAPTTIKTIAKETGKRMAVGGATGYAYDVSNNLQEGKTGSDAVKPGMGALIGTVAPGLIGVYKGTKAVTKATAPKFINSLIKPKTADFSYGKDPGKVVSELGITGNNLEDFGNKVTQVRQDLGAMLSTSYRHATDQGIKVDLTDGVKYIDDAIQAAGKTENNQAMVDTLNRVKNSMIYDIGVNSDGKITKISDAVKDLSSLTPNQAFDLKKLVSDQTKFTGNPSDDKAVNMILKQVFGKIKDKLNEAVGGISPEVVDLNEKYGSLISAELAIANRDAILKKSNMVSFPVQIGAATSLISGLTSAMMGTGASAETVVYTILAGATTAGITKALENTAVRTRLAAWLGKQDPTKLAKFFIENPGIKEAIYRTIPKAASLIHKEPQTN